MDTPVIILAGGKSRRMGRDKLELALNGRTLLESAVIRFTEEFTDVYLSVADAGKYPDVAARRIVDVLPGAGPLSGLHAALSNLPGSGVFLVAADLPYASPCAAKFIIGLCGDKEACIVRLPDGKLEPLFGYYSKSILQRCEDAIKSGDYRMTEIVLGSDTRYVSPNELGELWDDKLIYNVNYPEDYEKAGLIEPATADEKSKNEPAHNIFTNTMADMKWPDIQNCADNSSVVLLPMGVIEEHGPHLCLATDIYTAHIYCEAVKQTLEKKGYTVIIAPPFYWGICQAAKGFIGSFNIRPETAKALLFDILSSLKDFGFRRIFAINAHGDVEHKIVAMNAFKEACEQLEITACFPYEEFMLHHFGLSNDAPCFYTIKPQEINTSEAAVGDVHAGDIETATINTFYPHLVDTQKAKSLPDVSLGDNFEAWMFGNQLKQLSPQGYLGSPASYESVDIQKNVEDNAERISEAIITRLNRN